MTTKTIQDSTDLLAYLVEQAQQHKHWFGFVQQRLTGVSLVHQIASRHADKMTPIQVVEYVRALNNEIFQRMIKPGV